MEINKVQVQSGDGITLTVDNESTDLVQMIYRYVTMTDSRDASVLVDRADMIFDLFHNAGKKPSISESAHYKCNIPNRINELGIETCKFMVSRRDERSCYEYNIIYGKTRVLNGYDNTVYLVGTVDHETLSFIQDYVYAMITQITK
jgi:hypothetical protein